MGLPSEQQLPVPELWLVYYIYSVYFMTVYYYNNFLKSVTEHGPPDYTGKKGHEYAYHPYARS